MNLHKGYLRDLENRGVPIVPTHWINPRGGDRDLAGILARNGWDDVVLKPAVSAGSRNTYRFRRADAETYRNRLDAILDEDSALLQPFLEEIVTEGEWSFVFFGGELSHTVLKTPRQGDFRVQEHFGGIYRLQTPSAKQVEQARAVLARIDSPLLYARVDMIRRGDEMLLAELELTEPSLYFKQSPQSEDRFVAAYERALNARA
jgi:glutathione synthase/RimK-type ligase-like ATP-grasp enzyme